MKTTIDKELMKKEAKETINKHKSTLTKIGQTIEKLQKQMCQISKETDDSHLIVSIMLMIIYSTIGNMSIDEQKMLLDCYIELEAATTQCKTPDEILKKIEEITKNEEEIKHLYV